MYCEAGIHDHLWSCTRYGLSCREDSDRVSRAHPRRSTARRTSLSSGKVVSIKRLPGWYGGPGRWPSANTTRCTRRSAGIRRMWHSHWCLRVRTTVRRSHEGEMAYSRYDLPVRRCSCRELNPLIIASAVGVSVHASLPCVRVEQTLAAYRRSLSDRGKQLSRHS